MYSAFNNTYILNTFMMEKMSCLKYWFVSIFKLFRYIYPYMIWLFFLINLFIFLKKLFDEWVLCVVYIHSFIKVDCRYSSGSNESRLAIQWHVRSEHSRYFNRDLYGSSSMDFPVVEFKGAPPTAALQDLNHLWEILYCTYLKCI